MSGRVALADLSTARRSNARRRRTGRRRGDNGQVVVAEKSALPTESSTDVSQEGDPVEEVMVKVERLQQLLQSGHEYLRLKESKITTLPLAFFELPAFENLRILNLRGCNSKEQHYPDARTCSADSCAQSHRYHHR